MGPGQQPAVKHNKLIRLYSIFMTLLLIIYLLVPVAEPGYSFDTFYIASSFGWPLVALLAIIFLIGAIVDRVKSKEKYGFRFFGANLLCVAAFLLISDLFFSYYDFKIVMPYSLMVYLFIVIIVGFITNRKTSQNP